MCLLAMRSRAAYLVAKQAVQQLARGGAAHLYPQAHGRHKLLSICATRPVAQNSCRAWEACTSAAPLQACGTAATLL
jgi:hypothetical protein